MDGICVHRANGPPADQPGVQAILRKLEAE